MKRQRISIKPLELTAFEPGLCFICREKTADPKAVAHASCCLAHDNYKSFIVRQKMKELEQEDKDIRLGEQLQSQYRDKVDGGQPNGKG